MQLAITERNKRLIALQERWDSLREAKACLAREDYAAAMKTGVVCRRLRWVGGKDGREVEEYEINAALIESLNSVERRAAIEIGQEVDRQDINLGGKASERAALLAKAFTIEEMEAMKARMIAAAESEESAKTTTTAVTAPIIDVRPVLDKEEKQRPSEAKAAQDGSEGKRPSWRDGA